MADRANLAIPDGFSDESLSAPRGLARHASPLSLALLGALMALAFSGLLGGVEQHRQTANAEAVRLDVMSPAVIRNGELFEARITVTPRRAIADLVIGVTPSLWRDITINTMIPAPGEESHDGGVFRFSFGPAEPGGPLEFKIDGQINPSRFGGTQGRVIVYDGDAKIAETAVRMRVLP